MFDEASRYRPKYEMEQQDVCERCKLAAIWYCTDRECPDLKKHKEARQPYRDNERMHPNEGPYKPNDFSQQKW